VGNKEIVKIRQKYRGTAVLGHERKATELLKSLPTLSLHPKKINEVLCEGVKSFKLRGNQHIVLQATSDDIISIAFNRVVSRGQVIRFSVLDSVGKEIHSGVTGKDMKFSFPGNSGQYYHLLILTKSAFFNLTIKNVPWVVSTQMKGGLHLIGKSTPIYFYVPSDVKSFSLDMRSSYPRETAQAFLYNQYNLEVAKFTTVDKPIDAQLIKNECKGGFWKLSIGAAPKGGLDDVYLSFDKKLSGFVTLDSGGAFLVNDK
jgi:hypothetical protein